jgi:ribosomal protein L18E
MIASVDPVAAWLRREVKAGRLKPTIDESDVVVIAGILLRAGSTHSTPKTKAARASTSPAAKRMEGSTSATSAK